MAAPLLLGARKADKAAIWLHELGALFEHDATCLAFLLAPGPMALVEGGPAWDGSLAMARVRPSPRPWAKALKAPLE